MRLRGTGNLGLYVGATYLDSNLTANGSLAIPGTGSMQMLSIDQIQRIKPVSAL